MSNPTQAPAFERDALHDLLMQAPALIAVLRGKQGVIEVFNPLFARMWGNRDVIGKPMRKALPELAGQGWFERIEEIIETGKTELGHEKPAIADWDNDGTVSEKFFNFIYKPLKNAAGKVSGVMVLGFEVTDQVRARQKIVESEEKYRGLFESMDQGFCIIEMLYDRAHKPIDYRFLEVNPLFEQQTGLQHAEGKTVAELIPSLEQKWLETYSKVALTGKPARFTDNVEALNRWFEVYAYRVGGDDDRRVAVLFSDVTERRQREEALRKSEERLRLATGASVMVGTWDWDIAPNKIYADERFASLFSVDPKKGEQGAPAEEYMAGVHPEDADKVWQAVNRCVSNKSNFIEEYRLLQKDGSVRWVIAEGRCHYDKRGQPLRFPGVVVDITERKLAEQALQESEARFRVVSDNATTGLFIMDEHHRCTFMNPAAEKITGYTLGQVLAMDKPLHDIIHHTRPDGSHYPMEECPIDRALPQRNRIPGEEAFVRPDGSFYPVMFMASPIVKDGMPIGTVIEVRDITEEKIARQEQQRLAAIAQQRDELIKLNKAKDEFIALASHQLRTPATAVKQYISLLLEEYAGPMSGDQHEYLQTAYDSNERQLNIINDLLKTAQMDSSHYTLNKRPHDIVKLIKEAIADMRAALQLKQQKLTLNCSDKSIIVYLDRTEMKLVLLNLLENASKYSYPKTGINVTVERKDESVEISVTDEGVGIAEDDKERIFEKFTRVNNKLSDVAVGTGLGLYWVKQIVELHEGSIKVASEPGKGSTFIVRLPMADA